MKIGIPQKLKTEMHPFRQVAVTSFIKGGLSIILGIVLLLSVKGSFAEGDSLLAVEKIIAAIGLLMLGGRSVWRGYKYEYDFSLTDIYDPAHGKKINWLLGQRGNDAKKIAEQYAQLMHERAFCLDKNEKGRIKDWQSVFYKLTSKKGIAKLFDHLPYPITNFIASQSGPVAFIGFGLLLIICCLFVSYTGVISINMIYVNLFVLIGLLSWWQPARTDSLSQREFKARLRNRIILFVAFYLITVFLFRPYAAGVNVGIMASILILVGVMVYTALMSFRLIDSVFSKREIVNVNISAIDLAIHRVSSQPNNILLHFDNVIQQLTGWYFKGATTDWAGLLAGDQNRKGDFKFEYVYETHPRLVSTTYDVYTESQLSKIWKTGTALVSIGLLLFFIGILMLPGVEADIMRYSMENTLVNNSPGILAGLYFMLFGIALFFFGNKLVYEVYLFFNTEIFFESSLILFKASGNYDEFEQINGSIKRKDTSTDFTPDIKVCKVLSSVFVHPCMNMDTVHTLPRFLLSVSQDEVLLENIKMGFKKSIAHYIMAFENNGYATPVIAGMEPKKIE